MALTQISTDGIKNGTITGSDLATNVDLVDGQKLRFGNNQNLQIYYDGSSYIENNTSGHLTIRTLNSGSDINLRSADDFFVTTGGGNSNFTIRGYSHAQVELFYNVSKKFETTDTGVTVTSNVRIPDGGKYFLGTGDDMYLNHSGFHGAIANTSGNLYVSTNGHLFFSTNNNEAAITANANGSVQLYHDNVKKFETTSYGAIVDPDSSHTASSASPARLSLGGTYSNTIAITTKPKLTLWENDSNNDAMGFQITGNLLSVHLSKTDYNFAINAAGSTILQVDSGNNETNFSTNHDLNINASTNKSGVIRFNTFAPTAAGPNKIILWEQATWSGGFGVSTDHIDYYSGHTHCFYTGTTTSSIGEIAAEFKKDGAVELYHDGSKKF